MKISVDFFRYALGFLTFLVGISAVGGGYGLIFMDGLGMPVASLEGSPFDSYFWPGIILAFVVGGANLITSIAVFIKHKYSAESAAIAGFGLIIWVFTQMYIIRQSSFLQVIYLALGILTLVLTFLILRLDRTYGNHPLK